MKSYTVLATSGWQGDTWSYVSDHVSRGEALAKAASISSPNARDRGYIVAVVGAWHFCDQHHVVPCIVVDTSRVRVYERHLRSRCYHIILEPPGAGW